MLIANLSPGHYKAIATGIVFLVMIVGLLITCFAPVRTKEEIAERRAKKRKRQTDVLRTGGSNE